MAVPVAIPIVAFVFSLVLILVRPISIAVTIVAISLGSIIVMVGHHKAKTFIT